MIYVKESDVPKTKTRQHFIRLFLRNIGYTSYVNSDCTTIQCQNSKNRSITELHEIVQSRFPKTSLEAVVKILNNIIKEEKSVILIYCCTIHKVVVKYRENKTSDWISKYSIDTYYTTKGLDNFSLEDFYNIKEKIN